MVLIRPVFKLLFCGYRFVFNAISKWMRKGKRVCCFHFGRCGSTVLANMLGSHPSLQWDGELFHRFHERRERSSIIDPYQVLVNKIKESRFANYGFEMKFQHLDRNGLNLTFEEFLQHLKDLQFSDFVLLKRRNYLRQAISVARGQVSGIWHQSALKNIDKFSPLELDLDCVSLGGANRNLIECFEFLDHTYSETIEVLDRMNASYCQVVYEDHLQDNPLNACQLVVDFLQLPMHQAEITLQRLESRPINEIVSNFESLQKRLWNTPYEWMCCD